METGDVVAIVAIQNAFIRSAAIEWTDAEYSVDERRAWAGVAMRRGYPVLVAVVSGEVAGWAVLVNSATPDAGRATGLRWSTRFTCATTSGVEASDAQLIDVLVERATALGFHVMVAAVDGENAASLTFHERVGFVEVARMPQVGTKFGRWLDLVLLQRVLDGA